MPIIASWSGDGLGNGLTVTTLTAGTGDTPFDSIGGAGSNITTSTTGPRSPRLLIPELANQSRFVRWSTAIGSRTSYAVRAYVEYSGWPSSSFSALRGELSAALAWRLDIAGTGGVAGQLRLRDTSTNIIANSGSTTLPLNTLIRLEVVANSGSMTVKAYNGESTAALITLTGTVGDTINTIDFGNTFSSSPPSHYIDDMAFSDTASEIGPIAPTGAVWSLWNGSTEVPLTLDGVWNGSSIDPTDFDRVT